MGLSRLAPPERHLVSHHSHLSELGGIFPGLTNPSDIAKGDEPCKAHQPDNPCQVAVVGTRQGPGNDCAIPRRLATRSSVSSRARWSASQRGSSPSKVF